MPRAGVSVLAELAEPARTAVYLALATGLRVSELLATMAGHRLLE